MFNIYIGTVSTWILPILNFRVIINIRFKISVRFRFRVKVNNRVKAMVRVVVANLLFSHASPNHL